MKVITIIGARPQFIKAAAVSRVFKEKNISEVIVHTGQHFDENMSRIFFEEMGIPTPDYNLNIHGLSHGAMTGQMLEKTEEVLLKEKPDYVLVYGDTNSTLAGALAAVKIHIPVIHIEAGLRSFNMRMPEEVNRILTDRISSILFCPTEAAVKNLQSEGYAQLPAEVVNCGDVMEDSALFFNKVAVERSNILHQLQLEPGRFILTTLHRAENTDDPEILRRLFQSLDEINRQTPVVLPLHPRTAAKIKQLGIVTGLKLIEPLGYLDMTLLTSNALMIMTDSGGLQKEAFFFNRFCVTLREETEWIELVDHGYNFLAGSDPEKILRSYEDLKTRPFVKRHDFYGGGTASQKIAEYLLQKHG